MGKKRRYIHKVKKFGRKMFDFLDKLDGTQDSKLLSSKIDTIVSKITVADRGNQTMSLQFEGMGPGVSPQAEGLEKDRVVYKVDGVTVNANGIQTFAAASGATKGNKSRYKTTEAAPARSGTGASDVLLSAGQHTIEAHIIGEAAVAASATIDFEGTVTDSTTIIINDGAGKTRTYIAAGGTDVTTLQFDRTHTNQAAALETVIQAEAGHAGSILTSVDGNRITLTNNVPGAAGNQDIGGDADNVTISNGSKMAGGFDADDAVKSQVLSKKFSIDRSEISMTANADFLKLHTDEDNIQMNLDEITIVGKRPGEESTYDPSSSNGIASDGDSFKISATMKTGDDAAGLAAASHAPVTLTLSAGAEGHTNKQVAKLLQSDVATGKHVEVIVTLTARTAANADLVDTLTDTITFVVP